MHPYHFRALAIGAALLAAGMTCAHAQVPPNGTQTHKLKLIVLESGYLGKTLAKGYSTIEQASFSCDYYPGCTLDMSIMANVGTATCKSEWAIDGYVDGNNVDGGPLMESLPEPGVTQSHVWRGVYAVGRGNHTITFGIYLPCSANLNQWSVRDLINAP